MADERMKKELRPFLDAIDASNSAKGQLAEAYYRGGVARLVGAIERFTNPGPNRMRVLVQMVATLPAPDWITVCWLMEEHPYFDGNVTLTSETFRAFWVEIQFRNANTPSWMYAGGQDPRRFVGAWGAPEFGRFLDCPKHGRQFVCSRTDAQTGTIYDDGSRDERFHEVLACGCEFDCWSYANDPEVRRSRVEAEEEKS